MTFASSNICLMLQMLQNYYCAPNRVAEYCDECLSMCNNNNNNQQICIAP